MCCLSCRTQALVPLRTTMQPLGIWPVFLRCGGGSRCATGDGALCSACKQDRPGSNSRGHRRLCRHDQLHVGRGNDVHMRICSVYIKCMACACTCMASACMRMCACPCGVQVYTPASMIKMSCTKFMLPTTPSCGCGALTCPPSRQGGGNGGAGIDGGTVGQDGEDGDGDNGGNEGAGTRTRSSNVGLTSRTVALNADVVAMISLSAAIVARAASWCAFPSK